MKLDHWNIKASPRAWNRSMSSQTQIGTTNGKSKGESRISSCKINSKFIFWGALCPIFPKPKKSIMNYLVI